MEGLASIGLAASAYLGPVLLLVLYDVLGAEFYVSEPRSERTVEYMASMSLIPFPDASEEVREVTDELLQPPGPTKGAKAEEEGSDNPLEQTSEKGTPSPPKGAPKLTEEDLEAISSGGKSMGPTQDGEGDRPQDCLPDNPEIKALGDDRYRVKQDLVDYYVNHLNKAEELAQTFWQMGKGGEVIGFRIRRVRCGNDLYQLGFRGGDVVIAVNDEPVSTTGQIIKAYLKVRNKKKLSITLRRNRKERSFRYVLY